jgi:hypothetical protein
VTSTSDAGASRGRLVVTSPGARIDVLDAWFEPAAGGGVLDRFDRELTPGAYEVRMRIGAAEERALVVVRADEVRELARSVRFPAAAPVEGSVGFDPESAEVAALATWGDGAHHDDEALVVVVRGRGAGTTLSAWPPFELVDDYQLLPVPLVAGRRPGDGLAWRVPLSPGMHGVRWRTSDFQQTEQALWVVPGWQTVAFVPWDEHPLPELMSVHLVPADESWSPVHPDVLAVEALTAHLRSGTRALPAGPASENPLLVLLTEHQRLRALGAEVPDGVVDPHAIALLRATLGAEQPDVAALLGSVRDTRPPMLSASLDLMLAVHARTGFIESEDELEGLAAQRYSGGPWLRWNPIGLDGRRARSMQIYDDDRGLPPVAVARLADLLRSTAMIMGRPVWEVPDRLSSREIADRLGTTPAFVERVLNAAVSRARDGDESLVPPRLARRFTRIRDLDDPHEMGTS